MSASNDDSSTTKNLVVHFTKRDLILYALGIGCCSNEYKGEELRFVYERHPSFQMFPTFLLSMYFAAQSKSKGHSGIRKFPPESMTLSKNENGIIPTIFLRNANDAKEIEHLPILHMSQSLMFQNEVQLVNNNTDEEDGPVRMDLETRILSIRPRRVGTFVTTETKYYQSDTCVATAQMTALVRGVHAEQVISWQRHDDAGTATKNIAPTNDVTRNKTTQEFKIPSNSALLYRLSGDYNPIHVEGTDGVNLDDESERGPILHGLCTMGYATRAILQHVKKLYGQDNVRLTAIKCNFVKPVFVGDAIRVEVWIVEDETDERVDVCFCVLRSPSEEKVVDKGFATLVQSKTVSRL